MNSGTLSGIVTVILMLSFIGVCVWAYSARRRRRFEEAARIPLEDDEPKDPGLKDDEEGRS